MAELDILNTSEAPNLATLHRLACTGPYSLINCDSQQVPQSIGKVTNENFPNFAGVYTPHFAMNPHFLSNYDCTHSVLCNLTFTLFVLAMVMVG